MQELKTPEQRKAENVARLAAFHARLGIGRPLPRTQQEVAEIDGNSPVTVGKTS